MCGGKIIDNSSDLPYYPAVNTSVDTITEEEDYNCKEGNGFWLYNNLKTDKKPLIYEHLLKSAKEKVFIWDPYTNEVDAKLFELINSNVEVKCLTLYDEKKDDRKKKNYNRIEKFKNKLESIQRYKSYTLKLKIYNVPEGKKGFHDRYLLIDDEIYIVGSSMAYHNTQDTSKAASTSIHKVIFKENKEIITDMFWEYWNDEKSEEVLNLYEKTP